MMAESSILLTLQPLPHPLFRPHYFQQWQRYALIALYLLVAALLSPLSGQFILIVVLSLLLSVSLGAVNQRCFLCCKPIEVVFTSTEVQIKRYVFWRIAVQQETFPLTECTAVVSYFQTGAIDGSQSEICTVLLRQAYQAPIVLDWHGRQHSPNISLKRSPPSDMPSAIKLRTTISQATSLQDAGFMGKSNLNDVYFAVQSARNKPI